MDVVKCADFVIDLGPDAGAEGGFIVGTGTPEEIAAIKKSHTGRFLRRILGDRKFMNKFEPE
jgi:excinuclease ABC subunit A